MTRHPCVVRSLRANEAIPSNNKLRLKIGSQKYVKKKLPNMTFLEGAVASGFTHIKCNNNGRWEKIHLSKFCDHGGDRKKHIMAARRSIIKAAKSPARKRPSHSFRAPDISRATAQPLWKTASKATSKVDRKATSKANSEADSKATNKFEFLGLPTFVVNMPCEKVCKHVTKNEFRELGLAWVVPRGICGSALVAKTEAIKGNTKWQKLMLNDVGQKQFGVKEVTIQGGNVS